jgi:GR25 family glycosyltransferase involved in LPS biosynthesis
MSHYLLWRRCTSLDEPILILEHDAVFIRELPDFEFKGICQINDPKGGGRNGRRLSEQMKRKGVVGVQPKTSNTNDPRIPDGLAGNSAYVIKPFAAQELINKYHELGVWPNDATMCIQLFPYLEEYYPFITRVEQEISTSSI